MTTQPKTAAQLVAEAKQGIEQLTPAQVAAELAHGDAILVDLRESEERATNGTIASALHAPRGMLEFYADPSSPYHQAALHPAQRTILHCASGGRSALAIATLKQLGYTNVAHLEGGLNAWREAGQPITKEAP